MKIVSLLSLIVCISLALSVNKTYAQRLDLNGTENQVLLKGERLGIYEDSTGTLSINSLIKDGALPVSFSPSSDTGVFFIREGDVSYWFKIQMRNNSFLKQHYLLESFNYRIDSVLIYETASGKIIGGDSIGTAYEFEKRKLKHKNLTYTFWLEPGEEKVLYLKTRNRYFTPVELVLRKLEFFTSYAVSEYFFLGLFYGSILIIILLNILTAAYLKSSAHYYYSLYVFFVGTFFMSQDGTGFHFLWASIQQANDYAYMLSVFFMIIFLLLYTAAFLDLKKQDPLYLKIFYVYIAFRIVVLFINLVYFPQVRHLLIVDILPFVFAYYCAYRSYTRGYPLSNYFLVGYTILIFGFMYNFFRLFGWIENNVFSFYLVNLCFLLEMLIFYFALAEQIRFYKQTSHLAGELKKVIDDKEMLIEQFTYKTSHDLSGPVKSIIGLTNLALSKNNTEDPLSYMRMIQTSAVRLDELLKTISEINFVREHALEKITLSMDGLTEKVLSNQKIKEELSAVKIILEGKHPRPIEMDSFLLYTILSNLIIYQLRCLEYKTDKKVSLQLSIEERQIKVVAINNGELIPEKYHDQLFTIFFRLTNEVADIGTYLYLVKLCTDKLKGEIKLRNTETATSFEILIPI